MALWEGGRHWRGRPAEESGSLGHVPGICLLSSDFLSHSSPPVFHEMRRLASLHVPWCSTLPPMTTRRYTERKPWSKRAKTMMESLQVYITRKPLATEFLFQNLHLRDLSLWNSLFSNWLMGIIPQWTWQLSHWTMIQYLSAFQLKHDWGRMSWLNPRMLISISFDSPGGQKPEGRIHWRFLEKMYFLIKDPQDEQAKWFPVSCSPNGSLNYMPRNQPKSFLKGFLKIWSNPCPFTGALTISV